jgi:hypothetical protein
VPTDDTGRWRGILSETALVLSEAVGLSAEEAEVLVAPADLEGLSIEEATAELPEGFRAALSLAALSEAAWGVEAWKPLLSALGEGVRRFLHGRRRAIAVTGRRGSGRGSLLNRVVELAQDDPQLKIHRLVIENGCVEEGAFLSALSRLLELPSKPTPAVVERQLLEGSRRVIIVERAHHLYMRRIGGFAALREALTLLAATLDNVLWVWEVDGFAWDYLHQIHQVGGYFDQVLTAPLLEEAALRGLFTSRLESLSQTFPVQILSPRELDEAQRKRWKSEGFFSRLHQTSRGNLEAAGILFCRATRWSKELGRGLVLPIPVIPFDEALASYPRTSHLALAMLVEHEVLSRRELEGLLLLSSGHAQTILDTFARHSVVSLVSGGYQVNAPWLEAIHDHLAKWSIL